MLPQDRYSSRLAPVLGDMSLTTILGWFGGRLLEPAPPFGQTLTSEIICSTFGIRESHEDRRVATSSDWEAMEMGRRFVLVGLAVNFRPGQVGQVIFGAMFAAFFHLFIQTQIQPYVEQRSHASKSLS